jgi:hypothetical protein
MSQISKDVETVYRRLQVRRVTTKPFYVTIKKPMNINCESFQFLHFHIAIISFIFQLNAHIHLNVCIALLNVSYMFCCSLRHSRRTLITSQNNLLIVRFLQWLITTELGNKSCGFFYRVVYNY